MARPRRQSLVFTLLRRQQAAELGGLFAKLRPFSLYVRTYAHISRAQYIGSRDRRTLQSLLNTSQRRGDILASLTPPL